MAVVEAARGLRNPDDWPFQYVLGVTHRTRKGAAQVSRELRIAVIGEIAAYAALFVVSHSSGANPSCRDGHEGRQKGREITAWAILHRSSFILAFHRLYDSFRDEPPQQTERQHAQPHGLHDFPPGRRPGSGANRTRGHRR